jgi:hypothetical protein
MEGSLVIVSRKAELDQALTEVLSKIETQTVTCEDFNRLIERTVIGETTPEGVRDRLRRRTIKNATDSHQENETGEQPLTLPHFDGRVRPKRAPMNQQTHGRSALAHRHSARTQERNHGGY